MFGLRRWEVGRGSVESTRGRRSSSKVEEQWCREVERWVVESMGCSLKMMRINPSQSKERARDGKGRRENGGERSAWAETSVACSFERWRKD